MEAFVNLFGPVDAVLGASAIGGTFVIEYVLMALVLVNFVTRHRAHSAHKSQYEEGGAEAISRYPAHVAANVALILTSFYYLTLHHHGGMVMSTLVLGLFLSDFFEFEARKVEARREIELERPKGAIVASLLVLAYAAFQSLFWVIKGPWSAIV
ncbi:MAG: hypothetical protein ABEH35_01270 [Haloarculaceae archaeon]